MKLYRNINNIPIYNWAKIQESFINEQHDLSYLIIPPSEFSSKKTKENYIKNVKNAKKGKHNKELLDRYLELLYGMQDIDISLNKLYTITKYELIKYNLKLELNEHNKANKQKEIKNVKYDANKTFNEYLIALNKSYTEFNFKINYLIPDFAEKWKDIFNEDVPEELAKYKGMEFFLWEEYLFLINTFELNLRIIMSTPKFQEIFIKQKNVKINNIEKVNKRLEKDFKENNQYDKWFAIRFDFFDMNKIKFRAKSNGTILNEVISLSKILEQNIDTQKTTIGQFYSNYVEMGNRVIEANKPKENGNRK